MHVGPVDETTDFLDLPDDLPDHLRELVHGCVQYVYSATGITLDLTPETLPLLDHYLLTARDDRGAIIDLVAQSAGAYFGEVVRRLYPARWSAPKGEPERWRIELARCFVWFNPVDLALEAMGLEADAAFHVDQVERDALASALSILGDVSEEDFRRLSVRLEVLTALHDQVVARQEARGEREVFLGPEVYRVAIDAPRARLS